MASEANPKARVNKNKEERRASHEGSVHGIRAPSLQGSVPGAWAIIQRMKALENHPHRQSEEGGGREWIRRAGLCASIVYCARYLSSVWEMIQSVKGLRNHPHRQGEEGEDSERRTVHTSTQ
jgi:hypothetical protein